MTKKIAISQSNYIPWKGYFDVINEVDQFILYDDMQYTKRDWRNRNKIKTKDGLQWLSIPVEVKGKYHQKIKDVRVSDKKWAVKHWNAICGAYGKTTFFNNYKNRFEEIYLKGLIETDYLSDINYQLITQINECLSIKTKISRSDEFTLVDGKSEKLLNICKEAGASTYLSGPAAKNYLDVDLFESENIKVEWMDYSGYQEYPQLHGEFEHSVSILDLLFCTGAKAIHYMKSSRFDS